MGTYYRYVNYTRREYVGLSDLQNCGDKAMALVWCAPALAWLMMPMWMRGDGYCGRWAPDGDFQWDSAHAKAHDIRFVPDYDDWEHMDGFINVAPGVLQSMRDRNVNEDWFPQDHQIKLVQRVDKEVPDKVSATCKCGWKVGPIAGPRREHALEMLVSNHIEGR